MTDWLWLPNVPHDPAGYPTGIEFTPTGLLEHTTEGGWPGSYGVLTRGLVPSVQLLLGDEPGQFVQLYPINMVCYHAAGANMRKIGLEVVGYTGTPRNDWQIEGIAIIMADIELLTGLDLSSLYDVNDGPRLWIDQDDPVGSLPHARVDYPPDRSYNHYDRWEDGEHARAHALVRPPAPPPKPREKDDEMIARDGTRRFLIQNGYPIEITTKAGDDAIASGASVCDLSDLKIQAMGETIEFLQGYKPGEFAAQAKAAGINLSVL